MMKILRTIYLEKQMVDKLVRLSTSTRIPQAVFVREGVDLMLRKREKQLSGSQKRIKAGDYQKNKRDILRFVPKLRKVKKGSR